MLGSQTGPGRSRRERRARAGCGTVSGSGVKTRWRKWFLFTEMRCVDSVQWLVRGGAMVNLMEKKK